MIFQVNEILKWTRVALFVSGKKHFKEKKLLRRDKESHYIMMNGSTQKDMNLILECPVL
jgi:hypothetical protein